MLVSNFELLISRIAPGPGSPLNRKVVQGYFLSITNLDGQRDLNLNLKVISSKNNGVDFNRDFIPDTNAVVFFDNGPLSQNNFPVTMVASGMVGANVNFVNIFRTTNLPTIKPLQTALIAILPNAGLASNPLVNLEIRGHIVLNHVPKPDGSIPASQQIMLSAECRGTFLDNNFGVPGVSMFDFDQIAYSIALASGKAENALKD
jgi:hypothetical protein